MTDEKTMKTGTTTIAIKTKDGIILAADKRATAGNMIVNKEVDKIFVIEDTMALTTAGTVSDVQLMMKLLKAELRLKRLRTNTKGTVSEAANLLSGMVYSNIRKMSMIPGIAHFIFAGVDDTGYHVFDIYPDGSITEAEDYVSSGSGSVFAYGVLETLYKKGCSLEEGKQLATKAVSAALQRDSASGNGIDIVEISQGAAKKVMTKKFENQL